MREKLTDKEFQKIYQPYMQSPEWGARRLQAFEYYGKKCQACGRERNLTVHHADYTNLFNEKMDELRVLCKRCHSDLHKKFLQSDTANLRMHTDKYIREKGKPPKKPHKYLFYKKGKLVNGTKRRYPQSTSCVDDSYLLD